MYDYINYYEIKGLYMKGKSKSRKLTNWKEFRFKLKGLMWLFPGIVILLLMVFALFAAYDTGRSARDVTSAQAATTFFETFDGTPSSPDPFTQVGQNTWDIGIHSRNVDTWDLLMPFAHHHGPNCEAPLTANATAPFSSSELVTHNSNGRYEDAVFKCKDHVMTSIFGVGRSINDSYAMISMTPNHMVDFSSGEAVIRFNVTTFRTTQRDWIDVWIMPWDDSMQLPFDSSELGTVDLQGMPRNGVSVSMFAPNNNAKSGFKPIIVKNGVETGEFRKYTSDYNHFLAYEDYMPGNTGNPQRRDTVEIRISQNRIKVCMPMDTSDNAPSQTVCWADKAIGALPFTKGVVTLSHHSYTPNKDCSFYSPLQCGPDTWHWDDVYVSPAVPFKMIKADRRMVRDETAVNFNEPAPANSKLRFSAAGRVQLSFNGGAFQSVTRLPGTQPSDSHVASYFVPVPQGTTSVRFRMTDSGAGGVHAKDFAIWSQNGVSSPPNPTTASTSRPTVTQTVSPTPRVTATARPVDTATPRATTTRPNVIPTPTATSNAQTSTGRVIVDGRPYFLLGANMPWYNWGSDFGRGSNGGVTGTRASIGQGLARLKDAGVKNVRWWMFPGDPWQIKNGTSPTAVNQTVYQDIDAALALAEQYDVYYTFTLFSAATDIPRSWMTDTNQRNQLIQNLQPLFNRYKDNKRIIAWQVFNEPEWQIYNNQVTEQEVVSFATAVNTAIKSSTNRWLVTIGSAMLDSLQMWKNSNLDFYTAHWYDYMNSGGWCATCNTVTQTRSRFGLDNKPIVIGESYLGVDVNANTRLTQLMNNGYAGVLGWSLFGERTQDKMALDIAGMKLFSQTNSSIIGPQQGSAPVSTPRPTQVATSTPIPTSSSQNIITIRAAGKPALGIYPNIAVSKRTASGWELIGSTDVRGDGVRGVFETYQMPFTGTIAKGDLRIRFTNDYFDPAAGEDRNVRIQSVNLQNVTYYPTSPDVYSSGSWESVGGCDAGYKKSEWLDCVNAYFVF